MLHDNAQITRTFSRVKRRVFLASNARFWPIGTDRFVLALSAICSLLLPFEGFPNFLRHCVDDILYIDVFRQAAENSARLMIYVAAVAHGQAAGSVPVGAAVHVMTLAGGAQRFQIFYHGRGGKGGEGI